MTTQTTQDPNAWVAAPVRTIRSNSEVAMAINEAAANVMEFNAREGRHPTERVTVSMVAHNDTRWCLVRRRDLDPEKAFGKNQMPAAMVPLLLTVSPAAPTADLYVEPKAAPTPVPATPELPLGVKLTLGIVSGYLTEVLDLLGTGAGFDPIRGRVDIALSLVKGIQS